MYFVRLNYILSDLIEQFVGLSDGFLRDLFIRLTII
jgi:hypothetical protein